MIPFQLHVLATTYAPSGAVGQAILGAGTGQANFVVPAGIFSLSTVTIGCNLRRGLTEILCGYNNGTRIGDGGGLGGAGDPGYDDGVSGGGGGGGGAGGYLGNARTSGSQTGDGGLRGSNGSVGTPGQGGQGGQGTSLLGLVGGSSTGTLGVTPSGNSGGGVGGQWGGGQGGGGFANGDFLFTTGKIGANLAWRNDIPVTPGETLTLVSSPGSTYIGGGSIRLVYGTGAGRRYPYDVADDTTYAVLTPSPPPPPTGDMYAVEEGLDYFTASGALSGQPSGRTGSMAATEGQDTTSISGKVLVVGSMSVTETGLDVFVSNSSTAPQGEPANVVGLYYLSYFWDGIHITEVPLTVNVIFLFQARPDAPSIPGPWGPIWDNQGDGSYTFADDIGNPSITPTRIQQVRSRGQRVLLTIGGADKGYNYDNRTKTTNLLNSIKSMITAFGGLDGADFNHFENGIGSLPSEMVWLGQELRSFYGPNFLITAPVSGSPIPGWRDSNIMRAMNDAGVLSWVGPQFYDDGFRFVALESGGGTTPGNSTGLVVEARRWLTAETRTLTTDQDQTNKGLGVPARTVLGMDVGGFYYSLAMGEEFYDIIKNEYPALKGVYAWHFKRNHTQGGLWSNKFSQKVFNPTAPPFILAAGSWNEAGVWQDSATWSDGTAASPPANTAAPVVTGTATVGQTLTCSQGTWTNATSYVYQWRRGSIDISGATANTRLLAAEDEAAMMSCRVTATGAGGSTSVTSAAVGPVAASGGTATNTGWLQHTASSSPAGTGQWTNLGNLAALDGVHASSTMPSAGNHKYLIIDWAPTIPAGATIDGIEVRWFAAPRSPAGTFGGSANKLRWNNGASVTGNEGYNNYSGDGYHQGLGGATSKWGRTWTAAEINSGGLGVELEWIANAACTIYMDHMQMRVHYTETAAPPPPPPPPPDDDPAGTFTGGVNGTWLDPEPITRFHTTSTSGAVLSNYGTTGNLPQSGRWLDRSSNVRDVVQATEGLRWQVGDEFSSTTDPNAHAYIHSGSSIVGLGGATTFYFCIALRAGDYYATFLSDASIVANDSMASGNTGWRLQYSGDFPGEEIRLSVGTGSARVTVGVPNGTGQSYTNLPNVARLLEGYYDGTNLVLQHNGGTPVSVAAGSLSAGLADLNVMQFNPNGTGGTNNNLGWTNVRVYGGLVTKNNVPSAAQRTLNRTWCANKIGLTLP